MASSVPFPRVPESSMAETAAGGMYPSDSKILACSLSVVADPDFWLVLFWMAVARA